jgi:hypothetical protein
MAVVPVIKGLAPSASSELNEYVNKEEHEDDS